MPVVGDLIPSSELRGELERFATIFSKPKGVTLFQRGEDAIGLFFVRTGRIGLSLDCNTPLMQSRVVGPGAVIGLPATVAGSPYSLSAKLLIDSEVAFVPRHRVMACLKMKPSLCFDVMRMLSEEISYIRSALNVASSARRYGPEKPSGTKLGRGLPNPELSKKQVHPS